MYFLKLIERYDHAISDYLKQHNITQAEKLYNIKKNNYRHSTINKVEHSYVIRHNINKFLDSIFEIDKKTIKKLLTIIQLCDGCFLFQDSDKGLENLMNQESFFIRKCIKADRSQEVSIAFLKSNMGMTINDMGVSLYDDNNQVNTPPSVIIDGDINTAVINAISAFNQKLSKASGLNADVYDELFFETVKNMTFKQSYDLKNKSKGFTYLDNPAISNYLSEVHSVKPLPYHWVSKECLIIKSTHNSLITGIASMMFSSEIYTQFLTAFNFFHNYKSIMNESYITVVQLSAFNKLDPVEMTSMTLTIGNIQIKVNVSADGLETQFEMSRTNYSEIVVTSNDLSELYQMAYCEADEKISVILGKPLAEASSKDLEVVRMLKI